MRVKLITTSAMEALRRLLSGSEREYRIEWAASAAGAAERQQTGNADPGERKRRRAAIRQLLGGDPEPGTIGALMMESEDERR